MTLKEKAELLYEEAEKIIHREGTRFPGMSFEEGIKATFEYLFTDSGEHPLED